MKTSMKNRGTMHPLVAKHFIKGRLVRVHYLRGKQTLIGSGREARLRLLSSNLAGVCCALENSSKGWMLMDLGSQPDVKLNGKPFVEHTISEKTVLEMGDHRLELCPGKGRRRLFTEDVSASGEKVGVVKYKGRVVETFERPSEIEMYKNLQSRDLEISEIRVPKTAALGKEPIHIAHEMKKPVAGTIAMLIIFLAIILGLPMPKEEIVKPPENVYTKMIFDSKVLAQKKKQLVSYGVRSPHGTGNGNGSISEGAKGQQSKAMKAVASLRQAGVTSLISKIALRASSSAKMIAALAATPEASAAVDHNLGGMPNMPSSNAATGKSGIIGNGKGFTLGGIGTGGKGGGTGGYKAGTGLGTGAVGNGEVGLEDTESVVEGGLDKEVIAAVIREHLGQIRYCYERQLSANPDLYGKIKVRFSIGGDGIVLEQSVGQSTLKSAMVEECILRRIATWKFPKPRGGTKVLVSYPFLFKSVN